MVLNEKNSKKGGVCWEEPEGKESLSFIRFSRESLSININHKNPREEIMRKKLFTLSVLALAILMFAGWLPKDATASSVMDFYYYTF